jgi:hypothetical protein
VLCRHFHLHPHLVTMSVSFVLLLFTLATLQGHHCWRLSFPNRVQSYLNLTEVRDHQADLIAFNLQQSKQLRGKLGQEVILSSSTDRHGNRDDNHQQWIDVGNPNSRSNLTKPHKSQLLVIALDGFRYDYSNIFSTPNLDK